MATSNRSSLRSGHQDMPAPAHPTAPFPAGDWPEAVDEAAARLLYDRRVIALIDGDSGAGAARYQSRRITALVDHARATSPWWDDRLRHLRAGGGFRLSDVPTMTRDEFVDSVRSSGGPLPLPAAHGAAIPNKTSGSTGTHVSFFTSDLCGRTNEAHARLHLDRLGVDERHRLAFIIPSLPAHAGSHVAVRASPLLGQGEHLRRKSQPFTVEQHARWIAQVEPDYLCSHSGLLQGIVDSYDAGAAPRPGRPIAGLLGFAETVSPALREQARRVLNARVIDHYSCEETGTIAFQCPSSDEHLHIARASVFAEVLDRQGRPCAAGEIGRVHVTSLHNFASPVLRYDLGDLAAWHPRCPCGHPGPTLSRLLGRIRFLIRLPSGERQLARLGSKHWRSVAPFRENRLVQVTQGVIRAECVLGRPMSAEERAALVRMLEAEISPELTYEVAELQRIDWGPSYKRQDVVSLI